MMNLGGTLEQCRLCLASLIDGDWYSGAQVYLCKECHNCELHVLIGPPPCTRHKNVLLPGQGCGFVPEIT